MAYRRAQDSADAIRLAGTAGHRLLGGGTNLVDLMRKGIEHPEILVDVSGLSALIEEAADGSVVIGGGAQQRSCGPSADPRSLSDAGARDPGGCFSADP